MQYRSVYRLCQFFPTELLVMMIDAYLGRHPGSVGNSEHSTAAH